MDRKFVDGMFVERDSFVFIKDSFSRKDEEIREIFRFYNAPFKKLSEQFIKDVLIFYDKCKVCIHDGEIKKLSGKSVFCDSYGSLKKYFSIEGSGLSFFVNFIEDDEKTLIDIDKMENVGAISFSDNKKSCCIDFGIASLYAKYVDIFAKDSRKNSKPTHLMIYTEKTKYGKHVVELTLKKNDLIDNIPIVRFSMKEKDTTKWFRVSPNIYWY